MFTLSIRRFRLEYNKKTFNFVNWTLKIVFILYCCSRTFQILKNVHSKLTLNITIFLHRDRLREWKIINSSTFMHTPMFFNYWHVPDSNIWFTGSCHSSWDVPDLFFHSLSSHVFFWHSLLTQFIMLSFYKITLKKLIFWFRNSNTFFSYFFMNRGRLCAFF